MHAHLDLVDKFCGMGVSWVMAATDGPLLMADAAKRASEMAAVSAKAVAARAQNRCVGGNVNGNGKLASSGGI